MAEDLITRLFGGGTKRLGPDEATAEMLGKFVDIPPGMEKTLSELENREITELTRFELTGTFTGIATFNNFVKEFLLLRISHGRKGREEIATILKGRLADEEAKKKIEAQIDNLRKEMTAI